VLFTLEVAEDWVVTELTNKLPSFGEEILGFVEVSEFVFDAAKFKE